MKHRSSFYFLFIGVILLFTSISIAQDYKKDSLAFDSIYEETKETNSYLPSLMQVKLDTALTMVNEMLTYKINTPYYLDRKANILGHIGHYKRMSGNHKDAMWFINQKIRLKNKVGKDYETDRSYYQLAGIWHKFDDIEKVKKYYDSSLAMNTKGIKIGKPNLMFRSLLYTHYGFHYTNVDSFEIAKNYFLKGIALADSINAPIEKASSRLGYAEVISDMGNVEEALKLIKEALVIYEEVDRPLSITSAKSQLAKTLYTKGEYGLALENINNTIEFYQKENMPDREMREYPLKLIILNKVKDYKSAFNTYRRFSKLKDSLRSESNYKQLANLEADFKLRKLKSIDSLQLVKKQELKIAHIKQKANTRFWSVVLGLVILLGSIAFFYIRKRQKVKEQAYQNILLNNKVATKTEEINELLNETIQHIKSKERLAENLQKLSSEKEGVSLKSIIADLKASKADNAKLMLIKQNIEQVNFEFIKKLKNQHQELTKTDIEICSFIRIGLSRKEVANLRNTSLEAVKSSRFRLKKKLQLTAEESLDTYINSL